MSKRNLRTVPAALLMTTALSWSLPVLAQTGNPGTAPARPASAASPSTSGGLHPGAKLTPPGPAAGGTATPSPAGASTHGLPPGFEPAMPKQPGASTPGTKPATSRP